MGIDSDGDAAVTSDCERVLSPSDLTVHAARTDITVFGQPVPAAAAKTGGYTGLASYALPGSEGC